MKAGIFKNTWCWPSSATVEVSGRTKTVFNGSSVRQVIFSLVKYWCLFLRIWRKERKYMYLNTNKFCEYYRYCICSIVRHWQEWWYSSLHRLGIFELPLNVLVDPYGTVPQFIEALDEVSEDMVLHLSKSSFLFCASELINWLEYDTVLWFVRKHPQNMCRCLSDPVGETCRIQKQLVQQRREHARHGFLRLCLIMLHFNVSSNETHGCIHRFLNKNG